MELITGRYVDEDQLDVCLQQDGDLHADLSVCWAGVPRTSDVFAFKTYSRHEGLLPAMLFTGEIELIRAAITR